MERNVVYMFIVFINSQIRNFWLICGCVDKEKSIFVFVPFRVVTTNGFSLQ